MMHIDLTEYYYRNEKELDDVIVSVEKEIEILLTYRDRIGESRSILEEVLLLEDRVMVQHMKLFCYAILLFAQDTRKHALRNRYEITATKWQARLSFIRDELLRIPAETLKAWIGGSDSLKQFSNHFHEIRKSAEHTLEGSVERTIQEFSNPLYGWQRPLWDTIVKNAEFPVIENGEGNELHSFRDIGKILRNPDRNIREKGMKGLWSTFRKNREIFAFILLQVFSNRNLEAVKRGYPDYAEMVYEMGLSGNFTREFLINIRNRADAYRTHNVNKKDVIASLHGIENMKCWDMSLPSTTFEPPQFSVEQAMELIVSGLAPLGNDYLKYVRDLFDPGKHLIELEPGFQKMNISMCTGGADGPAQIFSTGYNGSVMSLRMLAHETGHAVQRSMLAEKFIPFHLRLYPGYLVEAIAMLNEYLVLQYLIDSSEDGPTKKFFRDAMLSTVLGIFSSGMNALLEERIAKGIKDGSICTANDLDEANGEINREFLIFANDNPELNGFWMEVSIIYGKPMCFIDYTLASALSLFFFRKLTTHPDFIEKFLDFISCGMTEPPMELLEKKLGISMKPDELVDANLEFFYGVQL